MHAAVVRSFTAPLEIVEMPVPEPATGQVRVRIEAAGVCGTDVATARGQGPVRPTLPRIPGHEGVGAIDALGAGVTGWAPGTRVAIHWLASACGRCGYCVSGRENLCAAQETTGVTVNGCYAQYAVADARYVVAVPSGIDPLEAAPLTGAGLTAYHAVQVGRVRPTDLVGVFGVGGVGHLAVQYARIAGAAVVAVDVRQHRLDLARERGAEHRVNAELQDPVQAVNRLGGVDVAVVTANAPESFEQAYATLRRGGRLVCVGLPPDGSVTIPIADAVLGGRTVVGSVGGTRADLAEVLELHAARRTRVNTQIRKLDEVNAVFRDIELGLTLGRTVLAL